MLKPFDLSPETLKSAECEMKRRPCDEWPRPSVHLSNFPVESETSLSVSALLVNCSSQAASRKVDDKVSIPSAAAAYWRLMPREHAYCPDTGISHSALLLQ